MLRSCYSNFYVAIATAASSFATIAIRNALSPLRVPGDTAALPLLLLTSFCNNCYWERFRDASVARLALLTALKLLRSCYCNCYVAIGLLHRVLLKLLLRTRYRYCEYQETPLRCHCY